MIPKSIGANGYVTGSIGISVPHAFLSRAHYLPTEDLGTLDPAHPEFLSDGLGVNASGQVVGIAQTAAGLLAGFLHDGSRMIDLNTRLTASGGWRILSATAISDGGLIAGQGQLNNGPIQAVLLVPFPVNPLVISDPCAVRR